MMTHNKEIDSEEMTKSKKSYSEKLKDPRWQRVRLLVFDRDRWACTKCKNTTENLQVHHKKYVWGREPWEYTLPELVTLCNSCHKGEHKLAPAPVSELVTEVQYEGLYKEEVSVLTTLQGHIASLQKKLQEDLSDELQEEILKNIMFLQDKRKEILNG